MNASRIVVLTRIAVGLALIAVLASRLNLRAYDIRVQSLTVLSLTIGKQSITELPLGGRVGNWRSDDTIIFDSPLGYPDGHATDIFIVSSSGGSPTLISSNNVITGWQKGDPNVDLPPSSVHVGNAWTCPGNEYILFQASEPNSNAGNANLPGAGVDNNVWIYRASSKKIWKLTDYPVNTGKGVLGPQCSEDPINMSGSIDPIPIVFGRLIALPTATGCGTGSSGGPSDGSCQWFGDWEVCYADVNRDSSTLDPVKVSGSYLSNLTCEKPRNIAGNPLFTYNGTGASISSGSTTLTLSSDQFTAAMTGAAITVPGAGSPDLETSVLTYTNAHTVALAAKAQNSVTNGSFTVENKVLYEPHRYVTRLGDLYFTSNRRITTHDTVGVLWNHTTQHFQEFAAGAPSGCSPYQNTWFDEFLTPDPTNRHAIFMSDRAQPCADLTLVPPTTEHYMCTLPNCTNIIRLTYFNAPGYPEYKGDGTGPPFSVSLVTAVRGAWKPDGMNYLVLDQYGEPGDADPHAQLNRFTLRYPSAELSGSATLRNGTLR